MKLQGGRCRPISVRMSSGGGVRGCRIEDPNLYDERREFRSEREASIFRGYLCRFVRTYLSSPGDSSSGPNTTVFGSRECLIPRCCMWLLSCRARGGHIPKPRETRSDTDAHEHANKQNYSSIGRGNHTGIRLISFFLPSRRSLLLSFPLLFFSSAAFIPLSTLP